MAETSEEINYEEEDQKQRLGGENENTGNASYVEPGLAFLFELNLVMVIASLSLSDQELSDFEEDVENLNVKEQQDFKAFVSKFNARKRGFNELKISDRRANRSKLQTKGLDSRHGRKM